MTGWKKAGTENSYRRKEHEKNVQDNHNVHDGCASQLYDNAHGYGPGS